MQITSSDDIPSKSTRDDTPRSTIINICIGMAIRAKSVNLKRNPDIRLETSFCLLNSNYTMAVRLLCHHSFHYLFRPETKEYRNFINKLTKRHKTAISRKMPFSIRNNQLMRKVNFTSNLHSVM